MTFTTLTSGTWLPDERLRWAELALEGTSIGDAFGQQFFRPANEVDALLAERALPEAPWHYTDDTVMSLSVFEVLKKFGHIDQNALALDFAHRYHQEPNRGYGGTAHRILREIGEGQTWSIVAPRVFSGMGSLGNGGAMRVAVLGAWFADDIEAVRREAERSAEVTHSHLEGKAGAVAVAVAAAWCCGDALGSPTKLFDDVLAHTPDSDTRGKVARASRLALTSDVRTAVSVLGNGADLTAPSTVGFALWCTVRHLTSFEDALWTTASGLGDRDTTCAIVGGLMALATRGVPERWHQAREPLPEL